MNFIFYYCSSKSIFSTKFPPHTYWTFQSLNRRKLILESAFKSCLQFALQLPVSVSSQCCLVVSSLHLHFFSPFTVDKMKYESSICERNFNEIFPSSSKSSNLIYQNQNTKKLYSFGRNFLKNEKCDEMRKQQCLPNKISIFTVTLYQYI